MRLTILASFYGRDSLVYASPVAGEVCLFDKVWCAGRTTKQEKHRNYAKYFHFEEPTYSCKAPVVNVVILHGAASQRPLVPSSRGDPMLSQFVTTLSRLSAEHRHTIARIVVKKEAL